MTELLNQGLLMTAIGMGLVFLALIFLWGLINLIARLPVKDKVAEETAEPEEPPVAEVSTAVEEPRPARRAQAAAAAVAAALALRRQAARLAPPPQGSAISPWQAARRGSQFAMNAHITSRKSRSSAR
jgi:sodium pump decarboxylase gamma subunit